MDWHRFFLSFIFKSGVGKRLSDGRTTLEAAFSQILYQLIRLSSVHRNVYIEIIEKIDIISHKLVSIATFHLRYISPWINSSFPNSDSSLFGIQFFQNSQQENI